MNNTVIKLTLLFLLPLGFVKGQEVLNTLTPEQKAYELSMVWKEMSYNFANMDHCQGLNMDSLYAAYIPKIQRTKDDFEHYLTMQEFVAHFHNSHTYCMMPQQLFPYLAMIRLQTECRDGRIYIRNISSQYADKVSVGDEIVRINGTPAVEWFTQHVVPLLSCTNQETLLETAMFTPNAFHPMIFQPKSYNTTQEMEVKTICSWFFPRKMLRICVWTNAQRPQLIPS